MPGLPDWHQLAFQICVCRASPVPSQPVYVLFSYGEELRNGPFLACVYGPSKSESKVVDSNFKCPEHKQYYAQQPNFHQPRIT
jgi:hypothetical protein